MDAHTPPTSAPPSPGALVASLFLSTLLLLPACEAVERDGAPDAEPGAQELAPEQEAFWASLEAHCGRAYRGRISDVTAHYRDAVEGREAVIHFFDCSPDRIHVPFHLDDDRSRNWILTRAEGTLRLKHDHRHPDGTEEEISQYGGDAPIPGLPTRQIFWADDHTAEILPDRWDNFWFLDFVDEETLQYGVHWPTMGHSVRFEFDLSEPVEAPPAPWGY